jgi:hypothetical protein
LTTKRKKHVWETVEVKMSLSMAARFNNKKTKVEVFTVNYPILDKIKVG